MGSHKAVTRADAHAPGAVADFVDFAEVAAPATPASGFVRTYAMSGGALYQKDDAGTETALGGAGGGGGFGGAQVQRTTAFSVPNDAVTAVEWSTENFDTDGYVDLGSSTTRITAPSNGKYRFSVSYNWDTNTSGTLRVVGWRLNGTTALARYARQPSPARVEMTQVSPIIVMSSGDYVEVIAYQNSGAARNLEPGNGLMLFDVERLGD